MFTRVLVALYLLSIVAGVAAISIFGVVPIPGGFMAPAAVYVVGVTLVLRDLVHEAAGRRVALLAVLGGAALSAIFSPGLAFASGISFLVSETLDLLVFEKVRDRLDSVPAGMIVSNAVSIPLDSLIFLSLAFGGLEFFWGQVVGKAIATALSVGALVAIGTAGTMLLERKRARARAEEEARLAALPYHERRLEEIRASVLR